MSLVTSSTSSTFTHGRCRSARSVGRLPGRIPALPRSRCWKSSGDGASTVPEDFARLKLTEPVDLPALKAQWLAALADADAFIRSRPPGEVGCLYYSAGMTRFVAPDAETADVVPHYGRPGGVLPRVIAAPDT